jgi:hypothetical protein
MKPQLKLEARAPAIQDPSAAHFGVGRDAARV